MISLKLLGKHQTFVASRTSKTHMTVQRRLNFRFNQKSETNVSKMVLASLLQYLIVATREFSSIKHLKRKAQVSTMSLQLSRVQYLTILYRKSYNAPCGHRKMYYVIFYTVANDHRKIVVKAQVKSFFITLYSGYQKFTPYLRIEHCFFTRP